MIFCICLLTFMLHEVLTQKDFKLMVFEIVNLSTRFYVHYFLYSFFNRGSSMQISSSNWTWIFVNC